MTQFKGKRSKKDILSGVTSNVTWSRKRYNNTVEYGLEDGTLAIRLHDTDIIKWMPNGDIILNSGGWQTRTTKDRFNRFLHTIYVFQSNNIWYIALQRQDLSIPRWHNLHRKRESQKRWQSKTYGSIQQTNQRIRQSVLRKAVQP